jgi:uncharacterized peroxidase-related enzyme
MDSPQKWHLGQLRPECGEGLIHQSRFIFFKLVRPIPGPIILKKGTTMNRLYTQPTTEATGPAAQLYAAIKSTIGMVPNTYVGIGSNSPAALEAGLHLDAVLKKSSLSGQEIEAIKLAASQAAECDYCLAAHTAISKLHGLTPEAIVALRHGKASGNLKLDALAAFTRILVNGKGSVPNEALQAVRQAGYTDAQIVDTTLAISSITFTNLFNRINNTPIDFPAAS